MPNVEVCEVDCEQEISLEYVTNRMMPLTGLQCLKLRIESDHIDEVPDFLETHAENSHKLSSLKLEVLGK